MEKTKPLQKLSKWAKVGKVAAVTATFFIVLAAGAYTWTGLPSGAAVYARSKNAAEKAGLFFNESQAKAVSKVPDNENAANEIAKIEVPVVQDYTNLTKEMVDKLWPTFEPKLQLIESAISKKYMVGQWHFSDVNLDEYESPRALSRSAGWENLIYYILVALTPTPQDQRIPRLIKTASILAAKLDDDHTFNGVRERNRRANGIGTAIRKLIPRATNNPTLLAEMFDALSRLDKPYDLPTMLKVENYRGMIAVEHVYHRRPDTGFNEYYDSSPIEFEKGSQLPRFREANLARIHEYFTTLATKMPTDQWDLNGIAMAVDAGQPILENGDWSYAVLRYGLMLPISLAQQIQNEVANRNALMQALAILKAHADPAKGLLLGGRNRLDQDGHSIRIAKLSKGWVVYSVGKDRKDDGGQDSLSRPPDYVVHLSMATVIPEPPKKPTSSPSSGPPKGAPAPAGSSAP